MARNRKNQNGARFGPAIAAFVVCLVVGGAGLGYVWQKDQIQKLGLRMRKLEVAIEAKQASNKQHMDHYQFLTSPRQLAVRVQELSLGLTQPEPAQIMRLWDVPSMTVPVAELGRTARLNEEFED